jgi:sRNA-binding regulator protein Hfq
MPIFHCPICNFKSFTEKEEKEHAKTHTKSVSNLPPEPKADKPGEQKKEFKMPDFVKRFLDKKILITLINDSQITGGLTGFNNYELLIDEKLLIQKHAILTVQEVETKP